MGLLEPKLRVTSDSEHLGCIWEFTFLTSSQMMWILLICGPDFGNTAPLGSPSSVSLSPLKIKKLAFCGCCLVTKSCPTLCDPMDFSLPDSSVHGILDKNIWSGLPFPPLGDLPNPGSEPASPVWQVDSLPLSHQGSPRFFLKRCQLKALPHFWLTSSLSSSCGKAGLHVGRLTS